jgi:hypothetical protein
VLYLPLTTHPVDPAYDFLQLKAYAELRLMEFCQQLQHGYSEFAYMHKSSYVIKEDVTTHPLAMVRFISAAHGIAAVDKVCCV